MITFNKKEIPYQALQQFFSFADFGCLKVTSKHHKEIINRIIASGFQGFKGYNFSFFGPPPLDVKQIEIAYNVPLRAKNAIKALKFDDPDLIDYSRVQHSNLKKSAINDAIVGAVAGIIGITTFNVSGEHASQTVASKGQSAVIALGVAIVAASLAAKVFNASNSLKATSSMVVGSLMGGAIGALVSQQAYDKEYDTLAKIVPIVLPMVGSAIGKVMFNKIRRALQGSQASRPGS